jgi:uncharacterized protein YdiU (UPF0061 family)
MKSPDAPASIDRNSTPLTIHFTNTYARLPERFFARVNPTPVASPSLIKINETLANRLGLVVEALSSAEGVETLAGNRIANGSEPVALVYAGHQFGYFVPRLGDGRANLLGEVMGRDGLLYDIQLKGSGPTPFSRRGDGRAVLGPVLREYLVSEAMAAMGVPTARALAAVATGETVMRETALPGAVLARVAASHLRVGTFQYFAAQGDTEGIRTLANYAIARHYPEISLERRPYRSLLDGVIKRQALLIARWMLIGFIHGVMNTDNMSISGETIDFGPCAFMESYDPDMVFSSIDHQGRYAYGNQPNAALWNLTRLAESLLPLLEQEEGSAEAGLASAKEALAAFEPHFEAARTSGMLRKLGLSTEREGDAALAQELLKSMSANQADFTLTFRRLCEASVGPENDQPVRDLFANPVDYDLWALGWRRRLDEELISKQDRVSSMRMENPMFIPRNHLVEAVIDAAVRLQDFTPFEELLEIVTHPFEERTGLERYSAPARPEERVIHTFCGT